MQWPNFGPCYVYIHSLHIPGLDFIHLLKNLYFNNIIILVSKRFAIYLALSYKFSNINLHAIIVMLVERRRGINVIGRKDEHAEKGLLLVSRYGAFIIVRFRSDVQVVIFV